MKRFFTSGRRPHSLIIGAVVMAAGAALLLAACDNSFLSSPSIPDETGTASGMGQVRVSVQTEGLQSPGISASVQGSDPWSGNGPARTAYPTQPSFYYTYTFTRAGELPLPPKTPDGNGVFTLETGSWNLRVDAYPDANHVAEGDLVATGSTGAAFTVSQDHQTSDISVTLAPKKDTGQGKLTYKLTYPEVTGETIAVMGLTWIPLAGTVAGVDYSLLPYPGSGTEVPKTVGAGQYLFTALLEYTAGGNIGKKAGKSEVVHIYQNLTTTVAFNFVASDFTKDFTLEPTPNAQIDYVAEKLTDLAGLYSFDDAAAVTVTDPYEFPQGWIPSPSTAPSTVVKIVKKGNGATTLDSAAQSRPIPPRPDAPTGVSGGTGKLTGVTTAMQYKKAADSDSSWLPITGTTVTGLDEGNYVVRYKATDSAFKSLASATIAVGHPEGSGSVAEIQFWTDKADSDLVTSVSSVELSRSAGETAVITAATDGYSDYQWTLNGSTVTPDGSADTYTFNSALKGNGKYTVGLTVKYDNEWYSTTITITVKD